MRFLKQDSEGWTKLTSKLDALSKEDPLKFKELSVTVSLQWDIQLSRQ